MCIAISKPAGEKHRISDKVLDDCFWRHSDGAGFAYVEEGKLVIKKGFFKVEEFLEAYKPYQDLQTIIHFRSASPGMVKNMQNCHPFYVDTGDNFNIEVEGKPGEMRPRFQFAIIHNGRLDWRHSADHSDTSCFVHDILGRQLERDPFFLDYEAGRTFLRRTICHQKYDNNKMVIMRYDAKKGEAINYIINETAGNWDGGVWYSNYTWKWAAAKGYSADGFGGDYYGHGGGTVGLVGLAALNAKKNTTPSIAQTGQGSGEKEKSKKITKGAMDCWEVWRHPDKNGWVWNFKKDKWLNIHTNVAADTLVGQNVPYFIDASNTLLPSNLPRYKPGYGMSIGDIAELNKPGDVQLTLLDGKKVVTVPRDNDVLIGSIAHLEKAEVDALVVEATCALKRSGFKAKEINQLTDAEVIDMLRSHAREVMEGTADLDDTSLDLYMINAIKEGVFRIELIECERAALEIERQATRN